MLAGHCLDAVQDRKCVFVLSGLKTISFTRFIPKEKVSFSISDIQSSTVKPGSSAACRQVTVRMPSRIGNGLPFSLVSKQLASQGS